MDEGDNDKDMHNPWVAAFSTLCFVLHVVGTVGGIINSALFFRDGQAMAVPGEAPAQGYMLFAATMSVWYSGIHIAGAYYNDHLYEGWSRSDQNRPLRHRVHAWAMLSSWITLWAWSGCAVLSGVMFRPDIQIDNLQYMKANVAACSLAIPSMFSLAILIWQADRPFNLPRKRTPRSQSESGDASLSGSDSDGEDFAHDVRSKGGRSRKHSRSSQHSGQYGYPPPPGFARGPPLPPQFPRQQQQQQQQQVGHNGPRPEGVPVRPPPPPPPPPLHTHPPQAAPPTHQPPQHPPTTHPPPPAVPGSFPG